MIYDYLLITLGLCMMLPVSVAFAEEGEEGKDFVRTLVKIIFWPLMALYFLGIGLMEIIRLLIRLLYDGIRYYWRKYVTAR